MKKTSFRLIFAALATAAALAACAKVDVVEQSATDPASPAEEGTRVITVSFGPKTRTTLDKNSLQPMFADGDSILLATVPDQHSPEAPQDTQTVAVTVDPTTQKATITTTLQGNLSAMYPARSAKLSKTGHYAIPVYEEQSGLFEDANVCRARINAGATTAEFENAYSLFIITPPDGTKKLTVRSLPAIGDDGQRTEEARMISTFNPSSIYTVTVSTPILNMPDTTYYVALFSGAYIRDLSFEAWFDDDGTTGSIKGIPTSKIAVQAATTGIENYEIIRPGTAYTIDSNNWHEYVTVANRKWATVNIGANYPEDAGEYFAWGDTTGYVRNQADDGWCHINADGDSLGLAGGFCWANCPHTEGTFTSVNKKVFTKYVPSDKSGDYGYEDYYDTKTVLDLEDDAANVNWGGAWRMPTRTEFSAMILKHKGSFDSGQHFGDNDSSPQIFLPAAGSGDSNSLNNIGDLRYWSSSLYDSSPYSALSLFFNASQDEPTCGESPDRYYGYTIRAIVDEYVATPDE